MGAVASTKRSPARGGASPLPRRAVIQIPRSGDLPARIASAEAFALRSTAAVKASVPRRALLAFRPDARVARTARFTDGLATAEWAGKIHLTCPAAARCGGKRHTSFRLGAFGATRFFAVEPEPMNRACRNPLITKGAHGVSGVHSARVGELADVWHRGERGTDRSP